MSPVGCVQMAGDVWEWTSSTFEAYPGFLPFPYPELSEIYFGDEYRVLRGGSWATDPIVARTSLRNWEDPAAGTSSPASAAHATRRRLPHQRRGLAQHSPRIPVISSNSACPATSGGEI